ncbi:MAG: MBL fold metallo-hydrolase [Gammaproteobacteria bacterium]|nr:MBL fold metallo-hydrolase [Gammaproteobacteria bacterium]
MAERHDVHLQRLSRRSLLRAAAAAVPAAGVASLGSALLPVSPVRAQQAAPAAPDITTSDLGGLVLLQGAGCNVVAMPGRDGALMIDGGLAANAAALLGAVYGATGNDRIHTLINTHWHAEQTGANVAVGRAGGVIFAHEKTRMYLANATYSAAGRREPLPEAARPKETTRGDGTLEFAGSRIDYGYLPQAHTDGDLYVHFPQANVLHAGGVVSAERWPLLDYRNGAWFGGRVRALEWLAELADADTRVVPAHGRPITGSDIARHRDIYLELFETMIGYMNMGFGPEDVVERNPLAPFEAEFGDPSAFLDGAYRSMLIAYVPD